MPDKPNIGRRRRPAKSIGERPRRPAPSAGAYAELRCKSNFSFLRGASHAEELAHRAAELGYRALAITDTDTLAGVVRMHVAAKSYGLKLLVGAEVHPVDAPTVTLYATDRPSYGRLARMITRGRLRMPKGECAVQFDDVHELSDGLIAVLWAEGAWWLNGAAGDPNIAQTAIERYREAFGDRLYFGAQVHGGSDDNSYLADAAKAARRAAVPLVAGNDVYYHDPQRRFLQDVQTCIRLHCTIDEAGAGLFPNAERHLKSPEEMARLFRRYPDAVERTVEVADRCTFSLDELRYEYPRETCPAGEDPTHYLARLTWEGAGKRFPDGIPDKIRNLIEHELKLIQQLAYEPYFLTVWDIVRFARSKDILCQGRGSAANSAVCYCLGITSVDPDRIDMLFERFVSQERNEPPDIDVDFEHERREEVFQYIYSKYGRERAGIAAEVITYRPKSAVRDVGKVLGLSLDCIDTLSKKLDWWSDETLPKDILIDAGVDPGGFTARSLQNLVGEILGFPRHLSQHVGGFVITESPLCEMVPLENGAMPDRTFVEWDKDDLDAMGMLKIDCLSLGMLTAIRKCFDMLDQQVSGASSPAVEHPKLQLHTVPPEDPAVYDMICRADTVGVFQIESRAQMSMLPRLRPRCFYDLVVEVAIVRPGPIQGGMVHPYLRRRNGEEAITYPTPAVEDVLRKTLGVPLFQEQAMRLAMVAAGFTAGEADQLRRAMGAWRKQGAMDKFREKLLAGMLANGLPVEFAKRCYEQIRGFGEYGFPESHAASFALLVYVSAWLKRYHPAEFCASVINSLPMGFYAPAQLVRDAGSHGIEVRRMDVSASGYDCRLETVRSAGPHDFDAISPQAQGSQSLGVGTPSDAPPEQWGSGGPALRLGMRLATGISRENVSGIERAQSDGPFRSVVDVHRRSNAMRHVLARLAAADAFGSMGLNRREALWEVLVLEDEDQQPLFRGLDPVEGPPDLPKPSLREQVISDYASIGLSLAAHPISLIRPELDDGNVTPANQLRSMKAGTQVRVAGLVLVTQRPSTASGIVFSTLEDETATANLIIRPPVYRRFRREARGAVGLLVAGRIERQGEVVHVQVTHMENLAQSLGSVRVASRRFH